jgi:ketosteroid isomerase-like protein
MRLPSLPAAVVLLLVACQPPGSAKSAELSVADKAAIDSIDQTFAPMAVAGDYAALVKAYYADDAIILAPGMPAATGHAAIEAVLHTFPPITAFQLHSEEIVGAGDLAYARGRYTMTMAPPGGPVVADSGKYLEIWRKQGGSWKVTRDMFNSDVPPPMPDMTTKAAPPKKP